MDLNIKNDKIAKKGRYAVLIDFGSTYTKMVLVDMIDGKHLKSDHFPSTVAEDATIALLQCFKSAEEVIGKEELEKALKLATSSAAGGLRMGVVGLSGTISLQAGKNAAFGAGAKLLCTVNGKLKEENITELDGLPLEIILLTGGYENGSTEATMHNAGMLTKLRKAVPVIYAGNSEIAADVRLEFLKHNRECYLAKNIVPAVGVLEKDEAEEIIREIFLERIVNMKGLSKVAAMLDRLVMPTPKSVLYAGELLSEGTKDIPGLGDLMIVDIGGATTDIHSFSDHVSHSGAKIVGTKEPFSKRTVEGDLGLNESKGSLIHEAGMDGKNICDEELAFHAARIASRRHAGRLEHTLSAGVKLVQHGKDLSGVKTVIGTGAPIIYNSEPSKVLSGVLRKEKEDDILLPSDAKMMTDSVYLLFAGGLLRDIDENVAMKVMLDSLKEVKP